jgi:23S rRNA (guanine745-N1)-methyltransferase
VLVERRAAAGSGVDEEEGHAGVVVVGTLELERVVGIAQIVEAENLHRRTIGDDAAVLADVVDLLRCPVCGAGLSHAGATLRCPDGHSFDIARQGYVNLVPGKADTPEMVDARDAFLAAGHFARLSATLAEEARAVGGAEAAGAAAGSAGGAGAGGACTVLDLGAGTGHHLARVLDALPDARGIALDASQAALRRAARAHPRAAAIGADAWKSLPIRDGVASVLLSIFAPRNAPEMARILAPAGTLIAVTPTTRHLYELVGPLGLLSVPDDKEDRLDEQLASQFRLTERRGVEHAMFLTRDEAAQIVRMGPSAWHVDEQSLEARLSALPDPLTVTVSVTLSRFAHDRSRK